MYVLLIHFPQEELYSSSIISHFLVHDRNKVTHFYYIHWTDVFLLRRTLLLAFRIAKFLPKTIKTENILENQCNAKALWHLSGITIIVSQQERSFPPQNLDDRPHAWKRVENNCIKKEEKEIGKKAVNT